MLSSCLAVLPARFLAMLEVREKALLDRAPHRQQQPAQAHSRCGIISGMRGRTATQNASRQLWIVVTTGTLTGVGVLPSVFAALRTEKHTATTTTIASTTITEPTANNFALLRLPTLDEFDTVDMEVEEEGEKEDPAE